MREETYWINSSVLARRLTRTSFKTQFPIPRRLYCGPALASDVVLVLLIAIVGCDVRYKPGAVAILHVRRNSVQGHASDYQIYKAKQASLVSSSFVAHAAMRSPELRRIKGLTPESICASISTRCRKSELIEVRLRQGSWSKRETTVILDNVLEAYLKEVVYKERLRKVDAFSNLGLYEGQAAPLDEGKSDLTALRRDMNEIGEEMRALEEMGVLVVQEAFIQ